MKRQSVTMLFERSTAALGAERGSTVSRIHRTMAALAVACMAAFSMQVGAENLLLKRVDGTTITQIPLTTSQGCTVLGNGDIEVRPQPTSGASNDGWCPAGGGGGGNVEFTVPLTVTPRTLTLGSPVAATWATTGATSCTASATIDGQGANVTGWTGVRNTSQMGLSFTPTALGTYLFMITCTNGSDSPTSTALSVTVGPPGECSSVPPSFGLTRQLTMNNPCSLGGVCSLQGNELPSGTRTIDNIDFISAVPWPVRVGNGTLAVKKDFFVALEFNTGIVGSANYGGSPPNRYGTIQNIIPLGSPGSGLISISECPGSFETADLPDDNPRCRNQYLGSSTWTWGVGVPGTDLTCRLQENKKYYLNLAFVEFATGQANCAQTPANANNPTACNFYIQPR
jgi:hypothetical protein